MDRLPTLWSPESVAVLGFNVMFRDVDKTGTLYICYRSLHTSFILLHVKFGGGLSIQVLKNRAARHRNRKVSKTGTFVQMPSAHFISHPAFFKKFVCVAFGKDLAHHVRVYKMTGTHSEESSHGSGSKVGFIHRDYGYTICRACRGKTNLV
jgi:hypothetical protein